MHVVNKDYQSELWKCDNNFANSMKDQQEWWCGIDNNSNGRAPFSNICNNFINGLGERVLWPVGKPLRILTDDTNSTIAISTNRTVTGLASAIAAGTPLLIALGVLGILHRRERARRIEAQKEVSKSKAGEAYRPAGSFGSWSSPLNSNPPYPTMMMTQLNQPPQQQALQAPMSQIRHELSVEPRVELDAETTLNKPLPALGRS